MELTEEQLYAIQDALSVWLDKYACDLPKKLQKAGSEVNAEIKSRLNDMERSK